MHICLLKYTYAYANVQISLPQQDPLTDFAEIALMRFYRANIGQHYEWYVPTMTTPHYCRLHE